MEGMRGLRRGKVEGGGRARWWVWRQEVQKEERAGNVASCPSILDLEASSEDSAGTACENKDNMREVATKMTRKQHSKKPQKAI